MKKKKTKTKKNQSQNKTEKELVDYVAKTKGVIGYIATKTSQDPKIAKDESSQKDRIKIIKLESKKK